MRKRQSFMSRFAASVLAVLLCLGSTSYAQEPDADISYVTTVYNEQSGLPTGEANDIIQTSDGYIWIGSYGGLIRYDASSFRNYSADGEIQSSSIRALFEDSSGRLWIGTNDSGVFVYEQDQFRKVECTDKNTFLCIRDFAETSDGRIYVASNSGLGVISDGVLTPVKDELLSGETVFSVAVDSQGRAWCAMHTGSCVIVKGNTVLDIYRSTDLFEDNDIYCLTGGENGEIYIGTSGKIAARLVFSSDSLNPKDFDITYYDTGSVTTHNKIRVVNGKALVCGLRGFCIIDSDGSMTAFTELEKAASVNSAYLDYEGNLWLASSSFGVIRYTEGCFETVGSGAGLEQLMLNAVTRSGDVYYVAADTGLFVYDSEWTALPNKLTELYDGERVRCVITDSRGRIWVAAYSENAVACYDPTDDSIVVYNDEKGLCSNRARVVMQLHDGAVAAGTQQGLNIIRDGRVVASYDVSDGMVVSSILCMAEIDGTLFVGTDGGGIYKIDKSGIMESFGFDEGLDDGVILRILEYSDKECSGYFISAGSSLYWYDGVVKKLNNFRKGAGSIFDLCQRDGKLWLFQNSGIISIDIQQLLSGEQAKSEEYSLHHGLAGSLNANTWNYISPEGDIYIVTRGGISRFGFEGVDNCLPKAVINQAIVDGELFQHPTSLALDRGANRLTIDFAALSYTETSSFNIAYKLEGFDTAETVLDSGKSGSVSYTNLPGGSYTFTMRIFDPEFPEEASFCSFKVVKAKRFYEEPLFWVLSSAILVIVSMSVVSALMKIKITRMNHRQREYQNLVEQSLTTFARTIDAKDKYTNGHSVRVAEYSRELARRMGKSKQEQEHIYYIAMLHDIGKIGIPDHILNKPGRLTDEEMDIIRTHPAIGGNILENFTALPLAAAGARYHHERYDGKGYCEGRAGVDIPEVARIIGVADTYDAMSSHRCYRKALPQEVIIEELKKNSGTQLDPEVVPHMLAMIMDGTAPVQVGHDPWDIDIK